VKISYHFDCNKTTNYEIFSLGSHCAGFTGKYLKIGKLPRLTAFDPARPAFEDKPPEERLDYTDAEFIDVCQLKNIQYNSSFNLIFN
jgi:hypothetical protein